MGSMKTISTSMNILAVLISVIYSYYLLSFIDASGFLWVLWMVSVLIMIVTSLLAAYARDEYYEYNFRQLLEKLEK